MQLYAQDEKGTRVFVEIAEKSKNYFCLECKKHVRLRGGPLIRLHFFHAEINSACRQNGKSDLHLFLQNLLQKAHPGAEQEVSFDSIQRIADVVCHAQKIIFEVQCSPMTKEEAHSRINDYRSLGYEVIWILSDRLFNKRKISAFEMLLQDHPHYYAHDELIYDLLDTHHRGVRLGQAMRRRVNVALLEKRACEATGKKMPYTMAKRYFLWRYHFRGDFLDAGEEVFEELMEKERVGKEERKGRVKEYMKALYYSLLETHCH